MAQIAGLRIHITGVVQGVGFRPFVYRLAHKLALNGWVRNSSAGVDIEADGPPEALVQFAYALEYEAPPLARIDSVQVEWRPANGFNHFEIIHSASSPAAAFQPISPDVSTCPDCLAELFDPADRRYRYPFINCTNCGPRFTIIEDIPYDRPLTTMASFTMCPACAAEYKNPLDRRFHAQPIACPDCGPQIWLEIDGQISARREDALQQARQLLKDGRIVGVKGLGGYHLACDAGQPAAVAELRRRKLRVDKPFAVMMADLAAVKLHCYVSDAEEALLTSTERPIVILQRRPDSTLAQEISPGQATIGAMLPYTPLHYLLLEPAGDFPSGTAAALVMTSGNLSEEPIATRNDEARQRLGPLADAFLMHDRGIRTRCDDAVVRVFQDQVYPLRRSRGYAPFPVKLPWPAPPLLATGAELKNTFCLTHGHYAFLSHHIGDMENLETLQAFEDGVSHLAGLFRVQPAAVAYDLHPNYLATRYALARAAREGLPAVGVQHHHAHIAAGMAEHGLTGDRPVIGVSFDGTGYGDDGAIWGGEFLIADYDGYQRLYHLAYTSLPGGDKAIKEPWRMALAWLHQAGLPWTESLPPVQYLLANRPEPQKQLQALEHQLQSGLNAPPTSSAGRLFDAMAALIGVRQTVNYEAQAAIEMEALLDPVEPGAYPFAIERTTVDPGPAVAAVVADLQAGLRPAQMAARFHNGMAQMVVDVCRRLRQEYGLNEVVLSGGVWQNMVLLNETNRLLDAAGFIVYTHRLVPANDGGLALGQAAVAAHQLGRPA
jgi:hydrogenase maturation protein HypF